MKKITNTVKDNIFSIDDPNSYFCNVTGFTLGHRILELKIWHPDKSEHLLAQFVFVQYFSGPMNWQGANFFIDSPERFLEIRQGLTSPSSAAQVLDPNNVSEMMDTWHLYAVTPIDKNIQVKIFAGSVHVETRDE